MFSEPDTKRYYQHGAFLSAVLGFVDSDNNGVYGLEAQYNDVLSGTAGRIVRLQNGQGVEVDPKRRPRSPRRTAIRSC